MHREPLIKSIETIDIINGELPPTPKRPPEQAGKI